jgi:hypothetical protein
MKYKPGSRWKSAVCSAEMVVVRPPKGDGDLACGGSNVLEHDSAEGGSGDVDSAFSEGVLIGKRYVDEKSGIEVLGAKPGQGSLSFNGRAMHLKDAKPLPASD